MKTLEDLKKEVSIEFKRLDDYDRMLIDSFLKQAFILGEISGSNKAFNKMLEIKSEVL